MIFDTELQDAVKETEINRNEISYYFGSDNRKHFLYDLDYLILAEGERWELSAPVISITGRQ